MLQAVNRTFAPQPEGPIGFSRSLELDVTRDGAPDRLGARDVVTAAERVERPKLIGGEVDDGPHDVIILRHQMTHDSM